MSRDFARGVQRERGASAVELALVLPILLLIVAAIIDFGRLFGTQLVLTQGAREGVRMLALGHPLADAQTRAEAGATGFQILSGGDTTLAYPAPVLCSAAPLPTDAASLTVEVSFDYLILDGISALLGGAIPASQQVQATGSMRCVG